VTVTYPPSRDGREAEAYRKEGKPLSRDDSSIRKYSSHNTPAPLAELIGNYLERREDFSKDQSQEIMKLLLVF